MTAKKRQNGFSVIEVILVLVVLALIGGMVYYALNNKSKDSESGQSTNDKSNSTASDDGPPKLQNLGLASLDSVDVTTNALRDYKSSGHKGLYIFGEELPGTPTRINPNIEYASLKEGTEVVSASDGEVVFIKEQSDSNDSEVFIASSEKSKWIIGYDHIVGLKVKKGDKVKAGDVIGTPARQGNGLLRFEIQVNNEKSSSDSIHVCPVTLLDSSVKSTTTAQLKSIQESWEKVAGDNDMYDIEAQDPVGCMSKEITSAQAEGKS